MFPDKKTAQVQKNAEGMGLEGSFQIEQHHGNFVDSTDGIIFCTEPAQTKALPLVVEFFGIVSVLGRLWGGMV